MTVGLFSLLFFPGILLHELSHYLTARLLGIRTGKISLLPKIIRGGKIRLGYVETAPTDPVRDALVGAAPLIVGVIAVYLISNYALGIERLTVPLNRGQWSLALESLWGLAGEPDIWVWAYLGFVISSTMFPSESDRRAWVTITIAIVATVGLSILAGAGPWMLASLAPGFNQVLGFMATIFGVSLFLHGLIAIPLIVIRFFIKGITQP